MNQYVLDAIVTGHQNQRVQVLNMAVNAAVRQESHQMQLSAIGRRLRHRFLEHGIVKEVVLATSFNNEGEATAHYISEMLKVRGIRVSRLARGVPVGAELEYVDVGTIARAFLDRRST